MMKKPKTKKEVRTEIEQQVQEFLQSGGKVDEHAQGETNQLMGANPFHSVTSAKPSDSRTLVNDEIAAIEARKKPQKTQTTTIRRRPRKKLIKDDFGDPIRWVWEE